MYKVMLLSILIFFLYKWKAMEYTRNEVTAMDSVLNITVLGIVSACRLLKSPVGVTTRRENRERWAVALKLRGKTYYNVNGKQILSDRHHPVILPKGCSYCWQCTEPGECIIVDFDAVSEDSSVYSFEISDNSFLVNTFSRIENCLHLPRVGSHLECNICCMRCCCFL